MHTIKQPNQILIGNSSAKNFKFPKNCLVITSKGAKKRGWLKYLSLEDAEIFDNVENNPSINTTESIIQTWKNSQISCVVGLGGGSCLDVAKFVAYKLKKMKILH